MSKKLTKLDIINRSLTLVNGRCITSLNDNSRSACAALSAYDFIVPELARMHDWNWLTKRVCLPCEPDCPKFGWDYQYKLPSDYSRIVSVREYSPHCEEEYFKIECGYIYVNEDCTYWKPNQHKKNYQQEPDGLPWGGKDTVEEWPGNNPVKDDETYERGRNNQELPITYVSDCKDPCDWDSLFAAAVAFKIAAEIAEPLQLPSATINHLTEMSMRKIDAARTADAHEDASGENNILMKTVYNSCLVQMGRYGVATGGYRRRFDGRGGSYGLK